MKSYQINQLGKKAREKAIQQIQESDFLWQDWWEPECEGFREDLDEIGVECKDFFFDIDRGNNLYLSKPYIKDDKKFLEWAGYKKEILAFSITGKSIFDYLTLHLKENRESNYIDLEYAIYHDYEEPIQECIEEIFGNESEFAEELTDKFRELLDKFLKVLREDYYAMFEEEYIIDICLANDYTFNYLGE